MRVTIVDLAERGPTRDPFKRKTSPDFVSPSAAAAVGLGGYAVLLWWWGRATGERLALDRFAA